MSNFKDVILVKLIPSEPDFMALTTFEIYHGKSSRFLLRKKDLSDLLNNEGFLLDTDIGSYIQVTRNRNKVHFRLTWLSQNFRNDVTGYIHDFDIPIEKVRAALSGQRIHHVEYVTCEKDKARLTMTDGANCLLSRICQDKLTKHALRRFFRDHFNYGPEERLVIYPDSWVNGFYFQCDRLSGGIVRHEENVIGRDGKEHRRVYFAMHT